MSSRTRPVECCSLRRPRPLSASRRERLLAVARALADAHRLEIVRLLAAQDGPLCACDIVEQFDLSQPTVSHHLRILKEAGLVKASRKGLWMFYEMDAGAARLFADLSEQIG